MNTKSLVCPVCRGALGSDSRRLLCENGHSFDLAKSGYCNLLRSVKKSTHGDNRDMIRARRDFLSLGYYGFLADAVASAVSSVFSDGGTLLDAGCGEGYYTERVLSLLRDKDLHAIGVDISKDACEAAKKRIPSLSVVTASLYDLPIEDASVDILLLLFSPFAKEEISRVLKRGGYLITAFPERRHLFGLKSLLYDTPYENTPMPLALDGYELTDERLVEKNAVISGENAIQSLFMMTPYYYRTRPEDKARLSGITSLETELSFRLAVYKKR